MPQPATIDTESPAPRTTVRRRWRGLALLTGTMVVDSDEAKLITTLFPMLRSALALPTSALGVLVAVGQLVGIVFGPLWTWLARRTSRKIVLFVCSGLWGVWSIAAGFSQDFTQLLLFTSIAAAGFVGAQPIVSELIADLFDDRTRGRAVGYLYGVLQLVSSVLGPVLGQLSTVEDGWRYGFFVSGALNLVVGVLILLFLDDPGIGASEPHLATLSTEERTAHSKVTRARLREMMRIRTFVLMLWQRILSSHLLILSFGVVFLVDVHGFSNAVAALVLLPSGIGYFLGTLVGGLVADRVQQRNPRSGRIMLLQVAQLAFAVVAFFGFQFDWGSIVIYSVFFAVLSFLQGVNPGINRPIVMAVVPPELRAAAFTVMLSIVQAIGWAIYALGAGFLADAIGLRATFFWLLVVVMIANGLLVSLIYRPYERDRAALDTELAARSTRDRPAAR
jgi:predicted MFS family arabinose efflux permease